MQCDLQSENHEATPEKLDMPAVPDRKAYAKRDKGEDYLRIFAWCALGCLVCLILALLGVGG